MWRACVLLAALLVCVCCKRPVVRPWSGHGSSKWSNNNNNHKQVVNITDVHIVQMNHLDVGYNGIPALGLINNILNIYFNEYFPRAIQVSQALRARNGTERLIYTTHAWLVDLYLHCPVNFNLSGIVLVCPNASEVAAFTAAVKRGDIVWHAGAFNTEYENCFNQEALDLQFQQARDLAIELGVPVPTTLSLRDVPGTTRSVIPHLVRNGIRALSVGVNAGSPAPDMPNPGVWQEPSTQASILFMQTGPGQGYPNNPGPSPTNCGGMCKQSCVVFPTLSHALCWAFRTDNSGPPMSPQEVIDNFAIAQSQFPGARVYASTYDAFVDQLDKVRAALPVTKAEAGDTWMTSTTADSWKMTFYREASRAYADCLRAGSCDRRDPRVRAFTRMLAKLPEHTWGFPSMDDSTNWMNWQFHTIIATKEPAYVNCLNSYTEQRDIAAREGMRYLGNHPLAATIKARMAALRPRAPSVSNLNSIAPAEWTRVWSSIKGISIAFDATGAISSLQMAGQTWADGNHYLGRFIYRTYNDTDYNEQNTCCYGADGRQKVANPQQTTTSPDMTGLWVDDVVEPRLFVLSLSMADLQHTYYGAPATLWIQVIVRPDASLEIDLQAFNKTATRLGEALFFSFLPAPVNSSFSWLMDKLGYWVDPLDVVENGGLHQHGVRDGVSYRTADGRAYFSIDTLDATVVDPVTPSQPATMFPLPLSPLTGPVIGFDVQLLQNAFSTNTPLFTWDPDYRWRFRVRARMSQ